MSAEATIIKSLQHKVDELTANVADLKKERVKHIELLATLRRESELAVKALTLNAVKNN